MNDHTPSHPHSLPRSTPEAQGVRSQNILAFLDALEADKCKLHSLMLLRHGQVIAEGWWAPIDPTCRQYVYSISKSFNATAIGFAVQEGLLSLDERVISFFPGDLPASVSDHLAAMCVKDLLTMTSGHAIDTLMLIFQPGLVNWAQSILAAPVDYPPGSHFLYNTGAAYLLSCILTRLTGQTVLDYLRPRLLEPLAIEAVTWDTCPRGLTTGGWGLSIKTEDLAKFGLFYLQKGRWGGRQLLSAAWVEEATRRQVANDVAEPQGEPRDWRQGYGYQFWRCQHGAYRADGAAGQFCVVLPEQDAVLVMTGETRLDQNVLEKAWGHLLPAMQDQPILSTPPQQAELQRRLAALQLAHPGATHLPAGLEKIDGCRYSIEENPLGVRWVAFSFTPAGCRFQLQDAAGEHQVICGNGGWESGESRMPLLQPSLVNLLLDRKIETPQRLAACGEWTTPAEYRMTWQYLETPHSNQVTCQFQGDALRLQVTSSLADPNIPILQTKEIHLSGRKEAV